MAGQLTKPDKNNNTTANVDDGIILSSEQCDVTEDGIEEKFDSTTDFDDRPVSSGADDDETSSSTFAAAPPSLSTTDVQTVSISSSYSNNPNNNSSNNTSTNTPMMTSNTDPYKDFSGVDTESFISTTLRNNPKDRFLLLRLETVLQEFIQNDEKTSHQFQAMNSYERMLVHRVAAFFGLDHNVDKNGQAVVVTKTANTRIPDFSFQKCIPEGESSDPNAGAFATDAALSSNSASNSNPTDIPTRRILRRHEKTSNHEHSTRNGLNDEHSHPHSSSTSSKHSSTYKPYSERMNNYAETRARIFNETPNMINTDGSNSTTSTMNNKTQRPNGKGNTNYGRPSYRKSQPNHHQNQQRSYLYPHAQTTTNSHLQTFATGKTMDPSSHLINPVTGRVPIYSSHPLTPQNLSMAQASLYGPMVTSNTNAGPIRVPLQTPFYPQGQQAPIDYDYKQQLAGAHIYNYVSMIPQPASNYIHQQSQQQQQQQQQQQAQAQVAGQTQGLTPVTTNNPNSVPSQHGTSIQLPILLHQQPTGQIQYLFPAQALQQQQQAQQAPQPSSANPYPLTPDGQYVQVFRPDGLSISGTGPGVLENNPNHHHAHHHGYPPTPTYHHHHPGPPHPGHPLNQSQQVPPEAQQQQQQQIPSQSQTTGPTGSQTNLATQPGSYIRLYSTATPANLSHPYPQATYPTGAPPTPGSFVQPGPLPPGSYMIPTQTPGAVPSYTTFDNGTPYPTAYVSSPALTNTGKNGMNNPQASLPPSIQYATNHLSNLSLQANPHDDYQARLMNSNPNPRYTHPNGSTNNHITATGAGGQQPRNFIGRPLVQSPNGTSPTPRMPMYPSSNHSYRPTRPYNLANTDKTMPSANENDSKTTPSNQHTTNTSESISLAGPAQE